MSPTDSAGADAGFVANLIRRLRVWDRTLARKALHDFETAYGLDLRAPRVVLADLDAVRRALTPEDRPLVEHHWSTAGVTAADGLGRLGALTARVRDVADVVGVVWDRVEGGAPESPAATRRRVEALCADRRIDWPNLVYDGPRAPLVEALRVRDALPVTRVHDRSGAVLRTFTGPLGADDVDAIAALVGA